jgi:hypothetical protein
VMLWGCVATRMQRDSGQAEITHQRPRQGVCGLPRVSPSGVEPAWGRGSWRGLGLTATPCDVVARLGRGGPGLGRGGPRRAQCRLADDTTPLAPIGLVGYCRIVQIFPVCTLIIVDVSQPGQSLTGIAQRGRLCPCVG